MRKTIVLFILVGVMRGWATQYYVSSGSGNDSNNGTSAATPWQTLARVNSQTFLAGDVIYLKRGDNWNEQLIPSHGGGTAGNPIQFDAYGTGAAPLITAAAAVPFVGGSWMYVSGNVWKTTVTTGIASPSISMVQFGKLYGNRKTGSCTAAIASKYDWCYIWSSPNLFLYVYSPAGTNPVTTYATDGSVTAIVAQGAGLQMIYVNGQSWLTMQHIRVQAFDYVGVGVAGASDNLVFANMEVDGGVPYGTSPLGFYVNASSGYGKNISFLNDDANLNYDGFRIDAATSVTVTNCQGYANRDAGLKDKSGNATYSYSHFYGNNIAQLPANDVVDGIMGSGNISSAVAPQVANANSYPARFSFTVDDVGSSANTEAYVNTLIPVFSARGMKFNAAVVPSYAVDWTSVNQWYAAGHEIDSHSWSHQYYTSNSKPENATPYPNAAALDIRYTGSGTAATLTIAGNVLSTNVTGAAGDNLNVNLDTSTDPTNPYQMMAGLEAYLAGQPHYSVSYDASGPIPRPNTHSKNLLSVANVDIKTAAVALVYDQTKLEPDELAASKKAIQDNVAGLTETFFVYPDGLEDPTIEADTVGAGYTAARGSLAMKGQDNTMASANSVYANGINVQNITSLGAIQFHGKTQTEIDQMASNLIFRAGIWGAPYGLFTHYNSRGDDTPDMSNTELGWMLDAIAAHGGTVMSNTAMAGAVTSGTNFGGTTRWAQNPTGGAASVAVAGAGSPTVGAGTVTAYPIDLNGVDRSVVGSWDIGASNYVSQRYGTGAGMGQWKVQ
ncbi:MAG TPA: polysaccharide deacetylase family protein [Candidatus Sulfotelmatobacter sp.]|nr:polysaccharide deacetylase family protein [Candidatus Sulfotelmatobacter sp.]